MRKTTLSNINAPGKTKLSYFVGLARLVCLLFMNSSKQGLRRIYDAMWYSIAGLKASYQETAFRQELWIFAIGTIIACWLPVNAYERLGLVAVLLLILIVEILNTAVEACINRISSEIHPLSKMAKDCGSAAVFLSILLALLVWGVVLYQHYVVKL